MILRTKKYYLTEIAKVERARNGEVYKAGTAYIQISATRGQIEMLEEAGTIERKYAVILPKIEIYPPYFKIALERAVPEFCARYQSTINIQIGDFEFFSIDIHEDYRTQVEIAQIMQQCDRAAEAENHIIDVLKDVKKISLNKMMC